LAQSATYVNTIIIKFFFAVLSFRSENLTLICTILVISFLTSSYIINHPPQLWKSDYGDVLLTTSNAALTKMQDKMTSLEDNIALECGDLDQLKFVLNVVMEISDLMQDMELGKITNSLTPHNLTPFALFPTTALNTNLDTNPNSSYFLSPF
jgi:hypothetical protein